MNLPVHSFPIATEAVCVSGGLSALAWHPSRGCTLGVEALSRSSWSYQRLASLTAVQGLCQAPTTRGGMRQSVLGRAGGERGGRRDSGLSGASLTWCQGHTASPLAACPHVGTARGGPAREGNASLRAGAGEPSLRSRRTMRCYGTATPATHISRYMGPRQAGRPGPAGID
jgi:hypothetical protein